jgi:CRISPR-associated protein Cmr2
VEDYSPTIEGESKGLVQDLKRAQLECLRALGASSSGPPPYYAVLLADGDRMGKAIDGLSGMQQHQDLGKALSDFASNCREIVERQGGSLVYSGGDDVLALLPLHTALRCADALQVDFAERIQKWCLPCTAESPRPTLSVGLAIAHHLSPMADALELARRAEKLAKGNNRNSLAVICSKRSGGTLEWVDSWTKQPASQLATWAARFQDGSLPNSAAFDLEDSLTKLRVGLGQASETDIKGLHGVAQALAKRSAGRRRGKRGAAGLDSNVADELANALAEPASWPQDADRLAAKLQLARLFGEAARAAWGNADRSQEDQ